MKFLLTGGGQREKAVWSEEWKHYEQALVISLDWDTGELERVLEYTTPIEYLAEKDANIVFKAGSIIGDKLYLCTQTEVLIYEYPSFKLIKHLTFPFFNDLHHVTVANEYIVVVSTGLDMVIFFNKDYEPVKFYNVTGNDPWHKFSKDIDYRKVITTKPHESHPNYVFQVNEEVWVSRFEQKDAVCLQDITQCMNIGTERIHDGIVYGRYVFFTTVNGTVSKIDSLTRETVDKYDLNLAINDERPLGWCRGLYVEDNKIFVAFSSLRSTKLRENLAWIKKGFRVKKESLRALPTRIIEYDLTARKIVKEVDVSGVGMTAIFSFFKVL